MPVHLHTPVRCFCGFPIIPHILEPPWCMQGESFRKAGEGIGGRRVLDCYSILRSRGWNVKVDRRHASEGLEGGLFASDMEEDF